MRHNGQGKPPVRRFHCGRSIFAKDEWCISQYASRPNTPVGMHTSAQTKGGISSASTFCLEASLNAKYADAVAGMKYQTNPHKIVGPQER